MASDEQPTWNEHQLKKLIESATQLRYWDDVAYFQEELSKLQAANV